jgi:hypothetical protein
MRRILVGTASLLLAAAIAQANPTTPLINPVGAAGPPALNDENIETSLQELNAVGKNLKAFSAKLKLSEIDNTLGDTTIQTGNVWFQKKPNGSAVIHVVFDMRADPVNNRGYKEKIEYLLDGRWLIDRNYQTKNEVKRQVLKPGQKMDLFKLGDGPFPLPIGQDPKDVHQAFEVRKIPAAKDDPANTTHLQLLPKPGTDLAKRFRSIDLWEDGKTHMPVRVDTVDARQGATTRSTELQDIAINPPAGLPDSDFELPNIDKQNWNRHVESLND